MLNISNNKIDREHIVTSQSSFQKVQGGAFAARFMYMLAVLFAIGFALLFFPWTQNIRAKGKLTTLNPTDREQTIHSRIAGRVEQWFVREGQAIDAGDTIAWISEIKPEYLDPNLVERTRNQADAKEEALESYRQKAQALANQIEALESARDFKLEQAENYILQTELKLASDSIEYETARINLSIAENQFERQQTLYDQGLKSLTDLQEKRQKLQESINKEISARNKWEVSKSALINARLNLSTLASEYAEKLAKAESDRQSALSSAFEAESEVNKLRIQQENYTLRNSFYHITAPQDGFITKALISGIGETIKEGQAIFSFVPQDYELAVEMYVQPIDLPLISEGREVRLQFDGWPALVFAGWPGLSAGTYSGRVVSFDRAAGSDGTFRVLVAPDPDAPEWPPLLRLGSGANGIAMLNRVPIWYELWRNLNGFPPDFYAKGEEPSTYESY
jgi:adhesin transport system membrane fusion protein